MRVSLFLAPYGIPVIQIIIVNWTALRGLSRTPRSGTFCDPSYDADERRTDFQRITLVQPDNLGQVEVPPTGRASGVRALRTVRATFFSDNGGGGVRYGLQLNVLEFGRRLGRGCSLDRCV